MGPAFTWPGRSLSLLGSSKARAWTQEMQPQRLESRVGMGTVCLEYSRHRPYEPIRYRWSRSSNFHYSFFLVAPIVLRAESLF